MTTTTRLIPSDDDFMIVIPRHFMTAIGCDTNSVITIALTDEHNLALNPTVEKRPRNKLAERFTGYNGNYSGEAIDWGSDVGGEIC